MHVGSVVYELFVLGRHGPIQVRRVAQGQLTWRETNRRPVRAWQKKTRLGWLGVVRIVFVLTNILPTYIHMHISVLCLAARANYLSGQVEVVLRGRDWTVVSFARPPSLDLVSVRIP